MTRRRDGARFRVTGYGPRTPDGKAQYALRGEDGERVTAPTATFWRRFEDA